jgi:uncharacterized membrane protein
MRNLNKLFKMKLTVNKIFILLLTLSFLGFIDATYLTIVDYKHIIPPCTITNGCEKVLFSSFARIYGIPLALFGSVYFFVSIVLDVLIFQHQNNVWLRRIFMFFNSYGALFAIFLLYLQFIVIQALCQYCMLVELILFLLFYFSILLLKRSRQREINPKRAVQGN